MITIPQLKPDALRTMEVDFGTTIAQGLWQRISRQLNWIEKAVPVGMVIYFYDSQTFANGNPVPDPKSTNWQFCDGSPITNPLSPMFGQNVPDLRNRFSKGSATLGLGVTGGTVSHNLAHSHGGATSTTCDLEGLSNTDNSDAKPKGNCHNHSIGGSLGTISVMPPYINLQPYMRIV